ncbi:MAG: RNB domain-containing ribonuclease, partial [Bdellovibrionales bacterium]|nr:RNB domain-containing ribonuclease [Bdellovibrionales bacterium]
ATSMYFPERIVHMFPELIAENFGSLLQGEIRPAVSCFVEFDKNREIVGHRILLSNIRVQKKMSYEEVDALLDPPVGDFAELFQLSQSYSERRLEMGGMKIPKRQVRVVLTNRGDLSNTTFRLEPYSESTPARDLVSEMMILANEMFATFAVENNIPFIFRSQPPQDSESVHAIQKIPPGPAYEAALRSTLKRSVTSTSPSLHATLGVERYGQVTSPVRRYLDLVNQRQIVSFLRHQTLPYTHETLDFAIQDTSEALQKARVLDRETHRFWVLHYLAAKASRRETIEATVTRDDGPQYQVELEEVFIPTLLRSSAPLKRGDQLVLAIQSADPRYDILRLAVKGK